MRKRSEDAMTRAKEGPAKAGKHTFSNRSRLLDESCQPRNSASEYEGRSGFSSQFRSHRLFLGGMTIDGQRWAEG
ncbi:hypothetical protein N7513_006869 [Penicillium frequentans]|nr:hypothetical protein N7513_006869 [Penicillium glabrum]